MTTQNWLVTGSSRSLGSGLIASILQRDHVLAIAAVRDPSPATIEKLTSLPKGEGSAIIVIKIDAASDDDPQAAVDLLQKEHAVTHLDVVISNAGVAAPLNRVENAPAEDFRRDFQVNALATLLLFQATWPLLQRSSSPKFIGISTCVATIGSMADYPWPVVAYGTSKAPQNFIVKKIHHENDNLVAFSIYPGWVQTDAGNAYARTMGREQAPDTIEDSVGFILSKIVESTKQHVSGTFQFYDGGAGKEYVW